MDETDLPRERIGPYRLEARLGKGGMGEVFLAFDERLERRVAIKLIRVRPGTGPEAPERFRREARAAARLNHPAIVQVHDLVIDEAGDAIVLEHVLGRPLSELVGTPALTPAWAVRLASEIAKGLAHAHAAGFVHRDLKAENVMVTSDGHAKILDFGLAKPLPGGGEGDSLTADGWVLGTYHAMSPEQAGGVEVDPRSDLFSLGALLYEMLAGRSPFRGANPLDTLKRVLNETPPPLATLRSDLPAALSALVGRLLAKNREERPQAAVEVARCLDEIAHLPGLAGASAASGQAFLSELPTGSVAAAPVAASPPLSAVPASTSGMSALTRRPWAVRTALLLLLIAGGIALYPRMRFPPPPMRVLVPPPTVATPRDPRLALAASGVLEAALGSLASLQGLAPLDPRQLGGTMGGPVVLARTTAAEEILAITVEPEGELARISLRRLAGGDGRALWNATFRVASDPAALRLLVDAVNVHLRRAYPDHPPRPGTPDLDVGDADYAAYLSLRQRLDGGLVPAAPELAQIEAVVRGSPRFLAAQHVAAEIALSLFASTREPGYLARARAFARQAEALFPGDSRALLLQFRVALAGGRGQEPEAALARLTAAMPGDPSVLVYRASLAEKRGRTEEALVHLREVVARIPSWRNLRRLAELEQRSGEIAPAREHLRQLLARSPGNLWGLEALASIELSYGDPQRAGELFQALTARQPSARALWTNLGLARFLAGRHEAAIDAYEQALDLEPGHSAVLLNLADAELALGRRQEAQDHYRQALARLEESAAAAPLSLDDRMAKAQCLAHLGRAGEAAELAQHTLQQSPDSPGLAYGAALVYALVGDRTSARVNARAALRRGMGVSWFRIAPFDFLRGDPELRSRLKSGALS